MRGIAGKSTTTAAEVAVIEKGGQGFGSSERESRDRAARREKSGERRRSGYGGRYGAGGRGS